MRHKLKYMMGNPGDIIKHGLLAEFVAWWGETYDNHILRIAAPFGGCPRGVLEEPVNNRLEILSGTVLAEQLAGTLPNTKNPIYLVGLSPSAVLKWKNPNMIGRLCLSADKSKNVNASNCLNVCKDLSYRLSMR